VSATPTPAVLTMVGAVDAAVCVDDSCLIPGVSADQA
jgi:hypothetical protein